MAGVDLSARGKSHVEPSGGENDAMETDGSRSEDISHSVDERCSALLHWINICADIGLIKSNGYWPDVTTVHLTSLVFFVDVLQP